MGCMAVWFLGENSFFCPHMNYGIGRRRNWAILGCGRLQLQQQSKLKSMKMKVPYQPKIKSDQDLSHFKCQKMQEKPFKNIRDHSAFKEF
jgi:hypothetical protein